MALLFVIAALQEATARVTGKPVLLSWAAVKGMAREAGRTQFNHAKSERELGVQFRPVTQTLTDAVAWFRAKGLAPAATQTLSATRG